MPYHCLYSSWHHFGCLTTWYYLGSQVERAHQNDCRFQVWQWWILKKLCLPIQKWQNVNNCALSWNLPCEQSLLCIVNYVWHSYVYLGIHTGLLSFSVGLRPSACAIVSIVSVFMTKTLASHMADQQLIQWKPPNNSTKGDQISDEERRCMNISTPQFASLTWSIAQ